MVEILGTIIAISTVTCLVLSYSRWCNRYFSSSTEPQESEKKKARKRERKANEYLA